MSIPEIVEKSGWLEFHHIDTDPLTPEQVAEKIIQIWGKYLLSRFPPYKFEIIASLTKANKKKK
jgi:hypothetical protein